MGDDAACSKKILPLIAGSQIGSATLR